MNRWTKRIAKGAAAVAAAIGAWAGYVEVSGIPRYAPPAIPDLHVEVTPARIARGKQLSALLCSACHEDATTHQLTGHQLSELPPAFGTIVSKNITKDMNKGIGAWSDGELAVFLRTGLHRDGQYVPPYMPKFPHLSDEDLASVIAYLRSDEPAVAAAPVDPPGKTQPSFLSKALTHTIMKPLPYPSAPLVAPPKTDKAAYGRYLVFTLDCYGCHSEDFKTMNVLEPEKTPGYLGGGNTLVGGDGSPIRSANLTPDDATGIGRWTEEDFVRALRHGFRPDGHALRSPMTPKVHIDDDDARAIYSYLRTVPAIRNDVPRAFPAPPSDAEPGRKLYVSYGCVSCHGDTGKGHGKADLTKANDHYPNDAELRAWIEDPPSKKPGTEMPPWKGIIKEQDFAPLMGHVRKLANEARTASN